MTPKEKYHARIAQGLCGRCGKPNNNGLVNCDSCRDYQKKTRELFKKYGVCPVCTKNPLVGDEKVCLECKASKVEYMRKYIAENRERLNANARERGKKRIIERKSKGLCTHCGRVKVYDAYVTCGKCRMKNAELARLLRYRG